MESLSELKARIDSFLREGSTPIIARLSLVSVGLITIIPFVQPAHDLPFTSFYSEWITFVLAAFACLSFSTRGFWENTSIPKVILPLVGFIILIAVQHPIVQHVYASQALVPALSLSCAVLIATLASWLRQRLGIEYVLRAFAWFVLCGGILHALLGLAQYLDLPGYLAALLNANLSGGALRGNVGQSNHYASQLTLASIALIYLFALDRLSASLAFPLMVLLVFVLTLTASRSVALYLGGVLLLSALGYHRTRQRVNLLFFTMTVLLLSEFVLAQFLLPPFSGWLHEVLVNLGFSTDKLELLTALAKTDVTGGIELRVSEWHKAWLMFLQSPLWGVGVGNYGWYSFLYQARPEFVTVAKPELFQHSHNLFTQVAAETGIVGLVLLLALLWIWVKQYLKHWYFDTSWLVGACLLVLFIHSNLEYPLWYIYFLCIAAFLLGASDKQIIHIKFTPLLGRIASGTALLMLLAILLITYIGYQKLANANSLIVSTTPEQAARTIQGVARNPLLTPWAEQVMAIHGVADMRLATGQLALTTRVMKYNPNPIKVGRQILYLALAGQTSTAIALLDIAAAAYPTHISTYVCKWENMANEKIQPIVEHARMFVRDPAPCAISEWREPVQPLQP